MTHKELVEIAYKWVLKNASCGIAFKEIYTVNNTGEIPDVIGFGSWEHSVLIECKVSRSDFLKDRNKKFRCNPELGMGKNRLYCCPEGLIKKEELPPSWGLIYVDDKGKAKCVYKPKTGKYSRFCADFDEWNLSAEHSFMYSILRRLFLKGLSDAIYDPIETKYNVLRKT